MGVKGGGVGGLMFTLVIGNSRSEGVEVWGQEGIEQVWFLMVRQDCPAEEPPEVGHVPAVDVCEWEASQEVRG